MDITTVSATLVSIKTATDIVKLLRNTDVSFKDAEQKLKLAELIEALADAKINFSEILEVLKEKDNEIEKLNEILKTKEKILIKGEAYYYQSNDLPYGAPFCIYCWDALNELFHLVEKDRFHNYCPNCKNEYKRSNTEFL